MNYTSKALENSRRGKYPHLIKEEFRVLILLKKNLISKYKYLLCVIYISKKIFIYKKGNTITNAFQKLLNESGCKPNKIWVDQGNEFFNR